MPIVAAVAVPHPPIMLPQVGKGEEARLAKTSTAFRQAMAFVADSQPDSLVVISPHAEAYADWFHISPGAGAEGDMARFGAPEVQVQVAYDEALAAAIARTATARMVPAGFAGQQQPRLDHGTLIPLVFAPKALRSCQVVRIGLSGAPFGLHYRLGQCIAAASGEKRVAVIASGDLSHKLAEDGPYGYAPEGPQLDAAITGALQAGAFGTLLGIDRQLAKNGAECGLRSFLIMAGTLDGRAVKAELLSYEGPFGVGYAVATFLPGEADEARAFQRAADALRAQRLATAPPSDEDDHVALAREALHHYIGHGHRMALPAGLPHALAHHRAGVFVSLHKQGALRGCIGTTAPTCASLAEEIMQNAVAAATEDPRFAPVQKEELAQLDIHVDVLSPPEDITSPRQLDARRYGVIVSAGGRRGLLLPDLDGVDTVEEQLAIARQKAGNGPDEAVQLQRFTVTRHE